jgi:hypothetical protein
MRPDQGTPSSIMMHVEKLVDGSQENDCLCIFGASPFSTRSRHVYIYKEPRALRALCPLCCLPQLKEVLY